jgi:DNA-directed RNA polymerase subunit F
MYGVITFVGDFPVEGQPEWTTEYQTIIGAIDAAKKQHEQFKVIENDEHYTVVLDLDPNTEDDVKWMIYQNKEIIGEEAQHLADTLAYGEVP